MPEVSRTSVWVAVWRAFGAREPDESVRNPDGLAERLIGPDELALMPDDPVVEALRHPYENASQNPEVMAGPRMLTVRTRFIDERLESAITEGTGQVVILGAGFDTRAYRLRHLLQGVRVFEVDHPATQAVKIRRAREALGEAPENLSWVAVDFRQNDLGQKLMSAGYRPEEKSYFIWEGCTMYLPEDAVRGTLESIVGSATPGSGIVFDYAYEMFVRLLANPDAIPLPPQIKQALGRMRDRLGGEQWIFGIPAGNERDYLASVGLELRTVMGLNSTEAVETYLTRKDGSIVGVLPASPQQGYLILEAVVPDIAAREQSA